MNQTKPWWTSKTIIASVVAVVGIAIRLGGYELAEADQAVVTDVVGTLMTGVGSLVAIWGRMVATKPIGAP